MKPQDNRAISLGAAQLSALPAETAQELRRALEASGTAARLGFAGLRLSESPVSISPASVGAVAAFRTEGTAGLVADVYFFDDWETLAKARALEQTDAPGERVRVTQNGAFAVRIIARGADAEDRVGEVTSAIAGEE